RFFFSATARTEISTLSLHDALPISTLSGDSINELPDDEAELARYLQQIAGSRGGADSGGGSGGFVIDGFSSGNLPPKDQIQEIRDRKSTRLNSSHSQISYAVFCLKK